jgi:hypothetical protein
MPPVPVRHDAEHVRMLRLMVTDIYPWRCEWAAWRMRFEQDPLIPGMAPPETAELVRGRAQPLCHRAAEAHANILYLRDEEDLVPVFAVFGHVADGLGHITAIQSRDAYEDAVRIAALLTSRQRPPYSEHDALSLPDLQWHVTGTGQFRVAQACVNGHAVTVRFGYLGGHERWVVDVEGQTNCANFRARADAMSKLGIGVALETYRSRLNR